MLGVQQLGELDDVSSPGNPLESRFQVVRRLRRRYKRKPRCGEAVTLLASIWALA